MLISRYLPAAFYWVYLTDTDHTEDVNVVIMGILNKINAFFKQAEFQQSVSHVDALRNESVVRTFPEVAELTASLKAGINYL